MRIVFPAIPLVLLLIGAVSGAPSEADLDFFEKKVRPVLADNCYSCHSTATKRPKGGLLLDTREGLLKGGDSGPALGPGKPEESLLLKAVRHDGDTKMPPKGKLPETVIADLEAWIKRGAPDPREKP